MWEVEEMKSVKGKKLWTHLCKRKKQYYVSGM